MTVGDRWLLGAWVACGLVATSWLDASYIRQCGGHSMRWPVHAIVFVFGPAILAVEVVTEVVDPVHEGWAEDCFL